MTDRNLKLPKSKWHVPNAPERGTPEDALGHANGALADIYLIVTDSLPVDAPEEIHELCRSVVHRILSSDSMVHTPPGWYRHDWEKEIWEDYLDGKIKPCGGGERVYPIPIERQDAYSGPGWYTVDEGGKKHKMNKKKEQKK